MGGLQRGKERGCPSGTARGRKPSRSHHPSSLRLHRSSPCCRGQKQHRVLGRTSQSGINFAGAVSQIPLPGCNSRQLVSPAEVKRGIKPTEAGTEPVLYRRIG